MRKIRIGFYAHSIDYAGTWRSHENIAYNLDRDVFEPFIIYWPDNPDNTRIDILSTKDIPLIPFNRSVSKSGPEDGWVPRHTNFKEVVQSLNLDILHVARGGYYEWPLVERLCPVQVETNIFGYTDQSVHVDMHICISSWVKNLIDSRHGSMSSGLLLHNPVAAPMDLLGSFRGGLSIPKEAIVYGRIGRPELDYHIAEIAFRKLSKAIPSAYFVNLGATEVKRVGNRIDLPPSSKDDYVEKFYNTIDVMLHARADGETFGCTIVEAMLRSIPVVSHFGTRHNGHIEILGEGGYIAKDSAEYAGLALELGTNTDLRRVVGEAGRVRAQRYLVKNVVPQYEEVYKACVKELRVD